MIGPPLHVVTPVWGAVWVDRLVRQVLPCWRAAGLMEASPEDRWFCITLGEEDRQRIESSPSFRQFQGQAKVLVLPEARVRAAVARTSGRLETLIPNLVAACFEEASQEALHRGAGLVHLAPTRVVSRGLLDGVRQELHPHCPGVLACALPVDEAKFFQDAWPPASWDWDVLAERGWHRRADSVASWAWEVNRSVPAVPDFFSWQVPDQGALLMALRLDPLAWWPQAEASSDLPLPTPAWKVLADTRQGVVLRLHSDPGGGMPVENPWLMRLGRLLESQWLVLDPPVPIHWRWRDFDAAAWTAVRAPAAKALAELLEARAGVMALPKLHAALLESLKSLDGLREAQAVAQESLRLDAEAWFRLGQKALDGGQRAEARGCWEVALSRNPEHRASLQTLMSVNLQDQRPTQAVACYGRLHAVGADAAAGMRQEVADRLEAQGQAPLALTLRGGEAPLVVLVADRPNSRIAKIALALQFIGWQTVLLHRDLLSLSDSACFPVALRYADPQEALALARAFRPKVYHLFSLNVDDTCATLLANRPGTMVFDPYDTAEGIAYGWAQQGKALQKACMEEADGVCARDLRARWLVRVHGYRYRHLLVHLDGCWGNPLRPAPRHEGIHLVAAGYVLLERYGHMEHQYLRTAELLAQQGIHFHLYPHPMQWESSPQDFQEFQALAQRTPTMHLHPPVPMDRMAQEMAAYDFGVAFNGCFTFGDGPKDYTLDYCRFTAAARVFEYLDAGLPVLDNRRGFRFRYHLLDRFGAVLDATEPLLQNAGVVLRQALDSGMAAQARRARQAYAVRESVFRLTAFYEQVARG